MLEVTEFHLLVHPDYDISGNFDPEFRYPYQDLLRVQWERHANSLVDKPTAALLYVSTLDKDSLLRGIEDPTKLDHPFLKYDVERIERWKQLLGLRLIVFPNYIELSSELLSEACNDHRLSYDKRKVQLYAFGEYTQNCVALYRDEVRRGLGIPFFNFFRAQTIDTLSLDRRSSMNEYGRHGYKEKF